MADSPFAQKVRAVKHLHDIIARSYIRPFYHGAFFARFAHFFTIKADASRITANFHNGLRRQCEVPVYPKQIYRPPGKSF